MTVQEALLAFIVKEVEDIKMIQTKDMSNIMTTNFMSSESLL